MASRVKATGTSPDQLINFRFRIDGVEKNSEAFKAVKRDINRRMRDVMIRVGERDVLPDVRAQFPVRTGAMAASLKIERERSGVFVGSRLRTARNRALGWIDFGGKRPRDSMFRRGPHIIVRTLDAKRTLIDQRVFDGVLDEFKSKGFEVGK
jgi:hypothetical protein